MMFFSGNDIGHHQKLESFKDGSLRKDISGNRKAMLDLVKKYWHCG